MDLIAFVPATDLARAVEFYGSVVGLEHVETTAFAAVFRVGGALLRVTKVDSFEPQPFTVLGWAVPDISSSVRTFTDRGVAFTRYVSLDQDALGIWTAPGGDRVAWFRDPEGSTLSLTQLA